MNINANNRWADIWQAECERAAFYTAAMLRIARMYSCKASYPKTTLIASRCGPATRSSSLSPIIFIS